MPLSVTESVSWVRAPRAAVMVLLLAGLASAGPSFAQTAGSVIVQGQTLADAIRLLQRQGLRVVFASALVTADLLVGTTPVAATLRGQLEELLAPHGLTIREGPGHTLLVVRRAAGPATVPGRGRERTGTIRGRVVHAWTGVPLADVDVQVAPAGRGVRTDAAGAFVLTRLDAGVIMLRAWGSGFAVLQQHVMVVAGQIAPAVLHLAPAAATHREHVHVLGPVASRDDAGVPSEIRLDRTQWEQLPPGLVDHPFRVLHALPRVAASDDFRSEFSVRGSPSRHIGLVVEGVATKWLLHTTRNRGMPASLAMFSGLVIDSATLRAGAYPRRHADYLGAELELTLREGSRTHTRVSGNVGDRNVTVFGDGPVGKSERGSWLAAVRHSYLDWPGVRTASSRAGFGFSDAAAKVAYDVTPRQQVTFSVLSGRSVIDSEDEGLPNQSIDDSNVATLATVAWRSTLSDAVVVSQRVFLTRQDSVDGRLDGPGHDRVGNREVGYRSDVIVAVPDGRLEAGARITWSASRIPAATPEAAADQIPVFTERAAHPSPATRTFYVHYAWAPGPALTISPGVRATWSAVQAQPTLAPWLLAEWAVRPGWAISVSTGKSAQLPAAPVVDGTAAAASPRAERATHVDVAVEHRASSARWQASVFRRDETDVLADPIVASRRVGGAIGTPLPHASDSLRGTTWGVELLVERRHSSWSGWAAYSYGRARYTDVAHQERFWANADQRHALTLFGTYRPADRLGLGATLRAGSGIPIPGYLSWDAGRLVVGDRRNHARLPAYARLDLRADYRPSLLGGRVTIFADILNALDRTNVGLADGRITPAGEAFGVTGTLYRRRVTGGLVVELFTAR